MTREKITIEIDERRLCYCDKDEIRFTELNLPAPTIHNPSKNRVFVRQELGSGVVKLELPVQLVAMLGNRYVQVNVFERKPIYIPFVLTLTDEVGHTLHLYNCQIVPNEQIASMFDITNTLTISFSVNPIEYDIFYGKEDDCCS